MTRGGTDRLTLGAFVALVVAAGGNVVGVKYVLREPNLGPLWAAAARFFFATLIFAVIARVLRSPFPRGRALLGAVLYGALSFGGFFGFVYWGLVDAPAGLAGIFLATVPLLTLLFAIAHGLERFRWDALIGALLVIPGTAVIFRDGLSADVSAPSLLAIIAGAACAAEGAIIVKTYPRVHPAAMNAIGMGVGTTILLLLMPMFNESFVQFRTGTTWAAQIYLVIIGSIGVFALYLFILDRWTASAASYEYVLIPLVAIMLSAWLLDETVTGAFVIGSALILMGVYVGALRTDRLDAPPKRRAEGFRTTET
ncbi:MAG: DMT family transporter [Actinomycetota bacterium]